MASDAKLVLNITDDSGKQVRRIDLTTQPGFAASRGTFGERRGFDRPGGRPGWRAREPRRRTWRRRRWAGWPRGRKTPVGRLVGAPSGAGAQGGGAQDADAGARGRKGPVRRECTSDSAAAAPAFPAGAAGAAPRR